MNPAWMVPDLFGSLRRHLQVNPGMRRIVVIMAGQATFANSRMGRDTPNAAC